MACIVKCPSGTAKGFLTLTDGELNDFVRHSPTLHARLAALKSNWLIGVHANCPIQQKVLPSEVVDTYIAGPGDLLDTEFESFHQIEMDCSNFCPDFFRDQRAIREKFWDVLFISRNMPFKCLEDMIKIIRAAMNRAPLRVLAIVAHKDLHRAGQGESEIIKQYLSNFSSDERQLFTLLAPSIDYPFCFDLPTLALLYHQSRSFLHVAENERHPRVVAYAWASGIPVIARPSVASLLPHGWQQPPGFYSYTDVREAPDCIAQALQTDAPIPTKYSAFHLASSQKTQLIENIASFYAARNETFSDGGWFLDNLDIRLARHHLGNGEMAGANGFASTLYQFLGVLESLPTDISGHDPEKYLEPLALQQVNNRRVNGEIVWSTQLWKLKRIRAILRERGLAGGSRHLVRRAASTVGIK